ncbi:MAG: hypothetical protein KHY77_08290 [Butyricicoccus pullicaecorum]|nr:hypothetical protein [Butyricicoccus pullicaecorum]
MRLPVHYLEVNTFEQQNHLFAMTKEYLIKWLENLWYDSPKEFEEQYYANISTVLENYKFENEGISFSRSYSYEPPLDYISVSIRIYDQADDYVAEYRAFYDLDLHIFDDTMR